MLPLRGRAGLERDLVYAEGSEGIAGIVVIGAGRAFIGGADIREFGKPTAKPTLPAVVERIEEFAKPVVAASDGVALGGSLEAALACRYRPAFPGAQVGLPEVKLGVVPGAGHAPRRSCSLWQDGTRCPGDRAYGCQEAAQAAGRDGVCEGFIRNRIFSAYPQEEEFLLEDGPLPHETDAALEYYDFPMGLFAVNDMASLEIAWGRCKR